LHAQVGTTAVGGGPAAASHRCIAAAFTGDTIPIVHLRSPMEDRALDADVYVACGWPTSG